MLRSLLKKPSFLIGVGIFIATLLLATVFPIFYHIDIKTRIGLPYTPPGVGHLLGTDHMGIDMISLLLQGLRSSLWVGLWAGTIATTVGTAIGVYGGFKGGILDDILTMTTNLFLVIPSLVLLILISNSLSDGRSLWLIACIIGLTTWTWTARAVRAQTSALKSRDHIALARMSGCSHLKLITHHILPFLLSYIFMVFIIQTASGIIAEASISMLGLGPYDTVSLGVLLNEALRNEALSDGAWWAFFPAMALITALAFSLFTINTSMEAIFNPRLRR